MSRPRRQPQPQPPLSNAQRQARFRARRDARLRELEHWALRNGTAPQQARALRNGPGVPARGSLRNAEPTPPDPGEDLDRQLTTLRQRGDQLTADYAKLLATPGLSPAEIRTIDARYHEWRQRFAQHAKTAPPRLALVSKRKVR
jgi:hypothetical protein